MKKYLFLLWTSIIGLCFTGCEKNLISPTPTVVTSIESDAIIEKEGKIYECYLIHTPEGVNTVKFTSPKNLEGLTFLWENGKYKVEMKGLSGEYNLEPWNDDADISTVMKILDYLNDAASLKLVSADESGKLFKGTAENIEYEVKLNSKNNIKSIFVPQIGLKVNFSGK